MGAHKQVVGARVLRNFLLFKTDLFLHQQEDEDLNNCRLGGDCAGWFYVRLLLGNHIKPYFSPGMEDWGWQISVVVNSFRIDINVWDYCIDHCWIFGVEMQKSFWANSDAAWQARSYLCDRLEKIVADDLRFTKYQWFEANPFGLTIKDF